MSTFVGHFVERREIEETVKEMKEKERGERGK